jgi:hypothetical protein
VSLRPCVPVSRVSRVTCASRAGLSAVAMIDRLPRCQVMASRDGPVRSSASSIRSAVWRSRRARSHLLARPLTHLLAHPLLLLVAEAHPRTSMGSHTGSVTLRDYETVASSWTAGCSGRKCRQGPCVQRMAKVNGVGTLDVAVAVVQGRAAVRGSRRAGAHAIWAPPAAMSGRPAA